MIRLPLFCKQGYKNLHSPIPQGLILGPVSILEPLAAHAKGNGFFLLDCLLILWADKEEPEVLKEPSIHCDIRPEGSRVHAPVSKTDNYFMPNWDAESRLLDAKNKVNGRMMMIRTLLSHCFMETKIALVFPSTSKY